MRVLTILLIVFCQAAGTVLPALAADPVQIPENAKVEPPPAVRSPYEPAPVRATSTNAEEPALASPNAPVSLIDQPTSDAEHDQNKTLRMERISVQSAQRLHSFKPIRLEVRFDEPMTLDEALHYAVDNNLPIKIARENMKYQNFVFLSNVANLLPNFSQSYNITRTRILNQHVTSLARVYVPRVSFPVFQGGSVVYGILGQYARAKGWRYAFQGSTNDALLDVYLKYNQLVLQRVLLQIRAKSVDVSEEQVRVNEAMEKNGTGTRFAVMQSQTQLAADRQALLQQEVATRQAALALNFSLNYPMSVNLIPAEETVSESPLFQARTNVDQLITLALRKRPELREYELFQFASNRNVQVAAAPLYPQLSFFTQYSYSNTTTSGRGAQVRNQASASSSGSTAGAGVFGGLFETFSEGMALTYNLSGLGLVSAANIAGALRLKKQSAIQANQELQTVFQQVRSSYLNWRSAREQIDNAATGVDSAVEGLRIAQIRLKSGVGTNLEVIQAQQSYINALVTQAQAIVASNQAQAQLLHDTGVISVDTLLNGWRFNI